MKKIISALSIITFGALCIAGCQQGKTQNEAVDTSGGFTPGKSGSLSLALTEGKTMTTGKQQGFRVITKDADGNGISSIRVTCDTERGLALIEPTAGFENTDENGEFSGKVGCTRPGSWLMICRLPSPSGVRDTQTIICQGDRPAGFNGWPTAGGGGLGGGNGDNNTLSSVRISTVSVSDTGVDTAITTSIDVTQGLCATAATPTIEPFFDSSVKFTITNNSPYLITFTSLKYAVSDAYGTGSTATSGSLSLTASAGGIDANGGTGTFSSLLFRANGGGKSIYGGQALTPGFKNVTFTLTGQNELGEVFTVKTATALSFDNFNRCTS